MENLFQWSGRTEGSLSRFGGKKREKTEGRVGLAAREERKQMSAQ